MLRWLIASSIAVVLASPAPALGQTKKKGDDKAEKGDSKKKGKKKSDEEGEPAEAKPEPKKDDDVVLDNREWAKKYEEERKKQQDEDSSFAIDTPFADTAPDAVALRAQRWKPGFGGGYRLGYAFPMGEVVQNVKLSQAVDGMIFLWGELGYWPIPQLFAGLYASGGYVLPDCSSDVSCSGWDVRGGPEVIWRILPFEATTPWVGVAAGYEWMMLHSSVSVADSTSRFHGFELAHFQAGVDVKTRGTFYGVFVALSLAKFGKYSTDYSAEGQPDESSSGDISKKGTHNWLAIGVRGTLE
jgi:hypothetical protein